MKMNKNIRLLGIVIQSEEKESKIPARVSGRVEKVYIKSIGSFINKNAPVVDFRSRVSVLILWVLESMLNVNGRVSSSSDSWEMKLNWSNRIFAFSSEKSTEMVPP